MTISLNKILASLLLSSLLIHTANAEVVRVPVGEQNDLNSIEKPERGLSTGSVEDRFGSPISRNGPVGHPPIYFWEYDQFTVYFEDNYVIHSVSKLKSKTAVKK